MFLFSLIKNMRVMLALGVVLALLVSFGVLKCNQKLEDSRRIKHNNQKRDAYVEKETNRVQIYEERERANFLEKKRVKPGEGKEIKLTPEQIKKKREKNFKELEGIL